MRKPFPIEVNGPHKKGRSWPKSVPQKVSRSAFRAVTNLLDPISRVKKIGCERSGLEAYSSQGVEAKSCKMTFLLKIAKEGHR